MSANYIINRDPTRFGGNQAHYLQRRDAAIEEGLALIKESVAQKKDLKELFLRLLSLYADRRKAIAVENRTEEAEHFSYKRIDAMGMIELTPIFGVYDEFREKIFSLFETTLKGTLPQSKVVTTEDRCLNRSCFFEVEVFSEEDIEEKEWHDFMPVNMDFSDGSLEVLELHTERHEILKEDATYPLHAPDQRNLKRFNEILKKLKSEHSFYYNHLKMYHILKTIKDMYRPASLPRYHTILYGKMRLEINGKKYALSEYIIPTSNNEPLKKMKEYRIAIIHQDRFLIDEILKEVAVVFDGAIRTDSSKIEELKDQVALIRYLFAHAMPYVRGSAAIGEWIEKTVYLFHKYVCTHKETTIADLEAFTSLWSTFRNERYDQTITLTPERK